MKMNKIYFIFFFVAAMFYLVGCEKFEDTVEASPTVSAVNPEVRFSADNKSEFLVRSSDLAFTLIVTRTNTASALEVAVSEVSDTSNVFTVPASVSFAAGAETANITVTIDPSVTLDQAYGVEIKLSDEFANPYLVEYNTLAAEVEVFRYCPYPMNDWAGNYSGDWTGVLHGATVTAVTTDNDNELRVSGLDYFIYNSWGESWVEGDGSFVITFSCDDVVTAKPQWIGDSDYPDTYGVIGSGTLDVDNKTITLAYDLFYGWDGTTGTSVFGDFVPVTLTLDGKALEAIKQLRTTKQ